MSEDVAAKTLAGGRNVTYGWIAAGLASGIIVNAAAWFFWPRLDPIVERWTRKHEPLEATQILQRAGVPALPVQSSLSVSSDPQVLERGVLTRVTHPVVGERIVTGPPWKLEGVGIRGPAPLIGQHNDYVLGEILGMSRQEIDRLTQEGVLE